MLLIVSLFLTAVRPAATHKRVVCYVPTYDESWGDNAAHVLDTLPAACSHINLAFALETKGKFDPSGLGSIDAAAKASAHKLQQGGAKILVSIGGWSGRNDWKKIKNTTQFANDAVKYLSTWGTGNSKGLDGLDLDVESDLSKTTEIIIALVKDIRKAAADHPGFLISWAGWMGGADTSSSADPSQDCTKVMHAVGADIDCKLQHRLACVTFPFIHLPFHVLHSQT